MSNDLEIGMYKTRDGWSARSRVALDDYGLPGRVIDLSTGKWDTGGIWSHAICAKIDNGFMTWAVFSDWDKTLLQSMKTRCTEKNVRDMHTRSLSMIEELVAECVAFYAKKEAA